MNSTVLVFGALPVPRSNRFPPTAESSCACRLPVIRSVPLAMLSRLPAQHAKFVPTVNSRVPDVDIRNSGALVRSVASVPLPTVTLATTVIAVLPVAGSVTTALPSSTTRLCSVSVPLNTTSSAGSVPALLLICTLGSTPPAPAAVCWLDPSKLTHEVGVNAPPVALNVPNSLTKYAPDPGLVFTVPLVSVNVPRTATSLAVKSTRSPGALPVFATVRSWNTSVTAGYPVGCTVLAASTVDPRLPLNCTRCVDPAPAGAHVRLRTSKPPCRSISPVSSVPCASESQYSVPLAPALVGASTRSVPPPDALCCRNVGAGPGAGRAPPPP